MKVRTQLSTVLIAVIAIGVLIAGYIFYTKLQSNARDEVLDQARLMMSTAIAVRKFTVSDVRPNLDPQKGQNEFLPQSVPAFAATEVIKILQSDHPNFTYKEATLNPTNPRDKAESWEQEIIEQFIATPNLGEEIGVKDAANQEKLLWLARPIKITNPGCLACHSTPDVAPPSMISKYGDANGFGWKLGEIVGAQIVTVPMTVPTGKASSAFRFFLLSLILVFSVGILILNISLYKIVCKPLEHLSSLADSVSRGNVAVENKLVNRGNNEVAALSRSFERMRTSIEKSITLIRKSRKQS